MKNEFVPYDIALAMKELGFKKKCFKFYWADEVLYAGVGEFKNKETDLSDEKVSAPLYQQALNFLYLASDGKINISINGKETNEERDKKFRQAIEDLRNLQNNKP